MVKKKTTKKTVAKKTVRKKAAKKAATTRKKNEKKLKEKFSNVYKIEKKIYFKNINEETYLETKKFLEI